MTMKNSNLAVTAAITSVLAFGGAVLTSAPAEAAETIDRRAQTFATRAGSGLRADYPIPLPDLSPGSAPS